ncbi:MAG TPA: TMEM175 family protein [Isosphaeraceae bacterium]|nr:TMEM175 family protein [Isosphaeraceae bacterium]
MSQTPRAPRRFGDLSSTDLGRLSGISDGIFSVGMTLLVLGLVVPVLSGIGTTEGQLWEAMLNLGPSFLVYTMSFVTLGIFWFAQGTQLAQLARTNRYFSWIHLLFLFAVTMVPFSTLLLAHYYWLKVALVEYWLNIVLLGGSLLAGLQYGLRSHLFRQDDLAKVAFLMRGRILTAQALYAGATALCLIFPTSVSIVLIILIQLNYVLAPRLPILHRF